MSEIAKPEKETMMDFRQDKLATCETKEYDRNGNLTSRTVMDFTAKPTIFTVYDAADNIIDMYRVEATRDRGNVRLDN